jgi:hypothetical protein
VIIPKGYRLGVSVLGRDFEFPGDEPWPRELAVEVSAEFADSRVGAAL